MTETILDHTSSLDGLLKRLPSDPQLRGKEFERVTKWFLETDPAYASELREIWLWDDWPGYWGPDNGIDLVAETQEGQLWAIQAKCYDPESQVPTSEIDSFISASSRPEFDHRLLISTGQLSKNAEYKLTHQEKSTAFLLYQQLIESPVDWLAYLDESRPALPDKKTPRPHQQKAIDDVIDGFSANDRGRLIMACGTGKTLVGVWVAERLKSTRTLVLVPSLSLINQISLEWQTNSTEPFRALFVCSDQTVTKDTFVSSTSELKGSVTLDPADIQRFLSGTGNRVVFSTYQSSPEIAAAQASGAPKFDLVIADEAHHCAGKVDSAFATVLDANRLKATRRLFMTATQRYTSNQLKSSAADLDIKIVSMDDTVDFGPEFHTLTFGQAIADELLSDYQVVIIGVTDQDVKRLIEDRTLVELLGITDKNSSDYVAATIGTLKAIKAYDLDHVLTFHSRIEKAKHFSSLIVQVNDILKDNDFVPALQTDHVSGEMPTAMRTRTLQRFREATEGISLLSNSRCLGEGVDVRAIDCVGFIDPRKSTIDIVQAVGRAIRKSDKEKIGTVLIPVFIDESTSEDPEDQLASSRFAPVWNVLTALKAHDEVLREELDQLRFSLGRHHGHLVGSWPGKIHIDIPTEVGFSFVDALKTKVVEMTTSSWEFSFGMLQAYGEEKGNTRVPASHTESISGKVYRLGSWVAHMRTQSERLPPERIARLNALPGWVWDAREAAWEEGFTALTKYIEKEGDALVPGKHVTEEGYRLGHWVNTRRLWKKNGLLSPERVVKLESLKAWVWSAIDAKWEEGFLALERYTERERTALVPKNHNEGIVGLGIWVTTQRKNRKRLSAERVSSLEKLPGWSWNILESNWRNGFEFLRQYVEIQGNAKVPDRFEMNGFQLGTWVGTQKTSKSRMSDERKSLLEELPGWAWNISQSAWGRGFAALEKYVVREGNSRIPQSYREDGFLLGRWVSKQRNNKTNLLPERISKLDNLNGWAWSHLSDAWEVMYQTLLEYVKREGHARVPGKEPKLGYWVSNCRFRPERLTVDQRSRLGSLPGWEWPNKS